MRGYNQQKDSTNNSQESFLSKNIEDYTLKDCEDFLVKYPKDLDADKVRERLQELKKHINDVINVREQSASENRHDQRESLITSADGKTKNDNTTLSKYKINKGIQFFWKIIFVLLCVFWAGLFILFMFNKEGSFFYNYAGDFVWRNFLGFLVAVFGSLEWTNKQADHWY